jgi:DNA (cytosine-5)-methyltransferase 1
VVDCVMGGSPCQDLSVAGKRAGLGGHRSGLWTEMLRIIRECEPRWVFWENVGGAVKAALPTVEADLASLGFRTAACTLAASDVGAPHKRQRLFVLAYRVSLEGRHESGWSGGPNGSGAAEPGHAGPHLADPGSPGLQGGERPGPSGEDPRSPRPAAECGRDVRAQLAAHVWPPGRDPAAWAAYDGPQPGLRKCLDGAPTGVDAAYRSDRLRLLGNGVVPQQAAAAFLVCLHRLLGGGPA